jgi:hypothetical protein
VTNADAPRFAELWKKQKLAFDAFVGKKASPERMEMFFQDLQSYDIDHVERAFEHHRKHGKQFPKPADIQDALKVTRRVEATEALSPVFDPENPFHCNDCKDAGWQERWCPGHPHYPEWDQRPDLNRVTDHCGEMHLCQTTKDGQQVWRGHSWVTKCPCRSTNPVFQRQRSRIP